MRNADPEVEPVLMKLDRRFRSGRKLHLDHQVRIAFAKFGDRARHVNFAEGARRHEPQDTVQVRLQVRDPRLFARQVVQELRAHREVASAGDGEADVTRGAVEQSCA